jgi:hypothetical protein
VKHFSNHISNNAFYIPFLYTYLTRQGSLAKGISWWIIYVIPTFYLFILQTNYYSYSCLIYFLSCFLLHGLYETGYIQNDTETIKKECNPTFRLYSSNYEYYEKNKITIYGVRFSCFLLLSVFILFLNGFVISSYFFLTASWSIIIVYQFYNRIRGRWNLPWLCLLKCLEYFSYIILFIPTVRFPPIIALFFSYIALKLIEMAAQPRYNNVFLQKIGFDKVNLTKIRVIYGFITLIVSIVLLLFGYFLYTDVLFFIYFFIYRFLIFISIYKGRITFKNYLK